MKTIQKQNKLKKLRTFIIEKKYKLDYFFKNILDKM